MFHSRQRARFILALAFCAVAAVFAQAHAQGIGQGPLVTIKLADMGGESSSPDVRHIADWAVNSGDHAGLPFAIVDKLDGRVFVFDAQGRLRGATTALVGSARGDEAAPDIGTRPISAIRPEERITPAGRFNAVMGKGPKGEDILWVDYDSALALHRVVTHVPQERRLQRLQSKVPADRRITYGCINVPVQFYDNVVRTTFGEARGVVYILPESRRAQELFGSYEVRGTFPQNPASAPPAVH
ncbi:MAG: hypothetical protein V4864_04600 [Pseudomonadota bacterium]